MSANIPDGLFEDGDSTPPQCASYILRCWTSETGQVRARLVGVHTGVSHPVLDLDELPGLVRRLVAGAMPGRPVTESPPGGEAEADAA